MRVAIIPARAGSKRIPGKNIKDFFGKPMIAYAIETAIKSELFDRIIVSTDDQKISDIAVQHGAESPFKRPQDLSNDYAGTKEVIQHCLKFLEGHNQSPDEVCCIYPCTPLLKAEDLKAAYALFKSSDQGFCFPVLEFPSSIMRALQMHDDGTLQPLFPENTLKRTQDTPAAFYDAGQFYWGSKSSWMNKSSIHGNAIGYLMKRLQVIDIDTIEDWKTAELLYKTMREKHDL